MALVTAGILVGPSVAHATDVYTCEDDCWDSLVADKNVCQSGPAQQEDACFDRADFDYEICIDICYLIYPDDPTEPDCDFWDWFCDPLAF